MTCSCGKPYEPTPSGRHTHRVLFGHAATENKEARS
jgi:hypothetical protein